MKSDLPPPNATPAARDTAVVAIPSGHGREPLAFDSRIFIAASPIFFRDAGTLEGFLRWARSSRPPEQLARRPAQTSTPVSVTTNNTRQSISGWQVLGWT